MTKPEVVRCPDGHYRRAIYGLGPYIADYPEQAFLACIVQGWCPKYVYIHLCISYYQCNFCRCTIPLNRPDALGVRRSHEHTEALAEVLELGVLWDEYGLVGDIIVS
jgi:hypothetical protein